MVAGASWDDSAVFAGLRPSGRGTNYWADSAVNARSHSDGRLAGVVAGVPGLDVFNV